MAKNVSGWKVGAGSSDSAVSRGGATWTIFFFGFGVSTLGVSIGGGRPDIGRNRQERRAAPRQARSGRRGPRRASRQAWSRAGGGRRRRGGGRRGRGGLRSGAASAQAAGRRVLRRGGAGPNQSERREPAAEYQPQRSSSMPDPLKSNKCLNARLSLFLVVKGRMRRLLHGKAAHIIPTITICSRRGPCAPSSKVCSISPERDGPVIRLSVRGMTPLP